MTYTHTGPDFEALAAGAQACADMPYPFRLYLWGADGWEVEDYFNNLDEAADAYVDGYEHWGEGQLIMEIDIHGNGKDVTADARLHIEMWCEKRGETAPWIEPELTPYKLECRRLEERYKIEREYGE